MTEAGLIGRLDALAGSLEEGGDTRLASLLDSVSNSMEKTAANRRMREFLFKKLEEWFPGKIDKMPKEVALEIVDGLAYSLLEIITPGKNRVTDKAQMYDHIDTATGKPDRYLRAKVVTLLEEETALLPSLSGRSKKFYKDFSFALADKLVYPGHPVVKGPSVLSGADGNIKQPPMAYLLGKVVPGVLSSMGEAKGIAPQDVVQELSSAISGLGTTRGSYAEALLKMLSGGYEVQESAQYQQNQRGGQKLNTKGMTPEQAQEALLARLGSSSIVYNKLRTLIDTTWKGPIDITVDVDHLERTFTPKHAEEIETRLSTISQSEIHKDEERLHGARTRMLQSFGGNMPAPGVPWNKGGILLEKEDETDGYVIREGWHRVLAMLEVAKGTPAHTFTMSAYVHTRVSKGVIKTLLGEAVKLWKLHG